MTPSPHTRTVYRIFNVATGDFEGVYSRAYHTEFDFPDPQSARTANCHNIHADKQKYKIAAFRVTYTLIDDDSDGPKPTQNPTAP